MNSDNLQLFTNGTLRAHFDVNNKIEVLDIVTINHTEYLPRSQLQALEQSEQQKQSPKTSKNMGKRGQQKQVNAPAVTLPESMVTNNGVPVAVMTFLEVCSYHTITLDQYWLTGFTCRWQRLSRKCKCCFSIRSKIPRCHLRNRYGILSTPSRPRILI